MLRHPDHVNDKLRITTAVVVGMDTPTAPRDTVSRVPPGPFFSITAGAPPIVT